MKKSGLFYVLVLLMTSCSTVPPSLVTSIPDAVVTTAPTSSPSLVTSTPEMVVTSAPTSPANPSPAVKADKNPFSAILARMYPGPFLLLGGTEDGEWLTSELALSHLSNDAMYHTFYADGATGTAKGSEPEYDQFCRGYRVETDSYPFGGRAVAITGDWNVAPRIAQDIPSDNAVYVDAVRNWLIGQNIPEPVVEIDQILRVDLEGDGVDEVLISASHFVEPTGHNVQFGDYSLVLMRKVVGNSVVIIPIVYDYYYLDAENQFPLVYGSLFVADLNNDNILEILVGVERWEGTGVLVYEVIENGVAMIFNMFCGL